MIASWEVPEGPAWVVACLPCITVGVAWHAGMRVFVCDVTGMISEEVVEEATRFSASSRHMLRGSQYKVQVLTGL